MPCSAVCVNKPHNIWIFKFVSPKLKGPYNLLFFVIHVYIILKNNVTLPAYHSTGGKKLLNQTYDRYNGFLFHAVLNQVICYLLFHKVSLLLVFLRFIQCQKTLWYFKVPIKYHFLTEKSHGLRVWSSKIVSTFLTLTSWGNTLMKHYWELQFISVSCCWWSQRLDVNLGETTEVCMIVRIIWIKV